MPTNKDFKRLVRARMEKTGEAYTAARANLLKRTPTAPVITAPAIAVVRKTLGVITFAPLLLVTLLVTCRRRCAGRSDGTGAMRPTARGQRQENVPNRVTGHVPLRHR